MKSSNLFDGDFSLNEWINYFIDTLSGCNCEKHYGTNYELYCE
jgi:hypothetical protein